MTPAMRRQWAALRAQWPSSAVQALREGMQRHADAVRARPAEYRDDLNRFIEAVTDAHGRLQRIAPYVEQGYVDRDAFNRLVRRYELLAAGVFSECEAVDEPTLAGAPVLLIIGGVGFFVVAIVWAVVAWRQAEVLDEQTELMELELLARVDANRRGETLQDSTLPSLPAPGSPDGGGSGWGTGAKIGVGLTLAAGLLGALALTLKKS